MRVTLNRNAAALLNHRPSVGYVLRVQRVCLTWKLKSLLWYQHTVAILQSTYYGTLQRGIDSLDHR